MRPVDTYCQSIRVFLGLTGAISVLVIGKKRRVLRTRTSGVPAHWQAVRLSRLSVGDRLYASLVRSTLAVSKRCKGD